MAPGEAPHVRVLVVTPHLQVFVRDQVAQLQPRVHHMAALVVRPRPGFLDPLRSSRYGLDRGLDLPAETYRSLLLSTRWPLPLDRLAGAGSVLGRLLDRGSFDLVHAHFLYPPGAVAARATRARRTPLVVTGHGFDVYRLPHRNARWGRRIREVLSASSAVITVSEANARLLGELGAPVAKIHVIPNGFDPALFHPGPSAAARASLGLPVEAPLLLAVGQLVPIKGYEVLLQAVGRLPSATQLVILGRGKGMASLQRLAARLGLAGRVHFRGEVPHAAVGEYMRAADLFVHSSRMEGNPAVLVEALGCGRPAVATRVGGIPDILSDRLGVLTEPDDPARLAGAVQEALGRRWDPERIASTASRWAWPRLADDILAVYRRVVSGDVGR